MSASTVRKLLTLTLPAVVVPTLLFAVAVEALVRARWDHRQGTPGLFVSDAARGQRLAPGYHGWFAGVPVRINNLGFRDHDDFAIEKGPRTFRILVLGDSVTFGHGAVFDYPSLLERLLEQWRGDVDWQVWNAGVPGYNTSQELAHLLEVGPVFQPDLVVVGFFDNDLSGNRPIAAPGHLARARSEVLAMAQRHLYSFELYKRIALTLAWRASSDSAYARRLEHLETESRLLASDTPMHERPEQQITPYDRLSDAEVAARRCVDGEQPDAAMLEAMQRDREWERWVEAVRGFQRLHAEGRYRIVFFLNTIPPTCPDGDFFYEGGSRQVNDLYLSVVRGPTPAVSAFDAFMHRRPSQMPAARAHAIGNSNMTKAEVLFTFLRDEVLPGAGIDPTR